MNARTIFADVYSWKIIRQLVGIALLFTACQKKTSTGTHPSPEPEPLGYSLLRHLPGIYQGPVVSTTSVGDFPFWGVDFRPVHASQVGGRSELDSANNIHLNFFVAQYQNRRVLCFRNGGYFQGMERITYLIADSVVDGRYYHFVEPITGGATGLCGSATAVSGQSNHRLLHHEDGDAAPACASHALDRP